MKSYERMKLVKDFHADFLTTGRIDLLLRNFAEQGVFRLSAPDGHPLAERFIGPSGVQEYFRRLALAIEFLEVHEADIMASEDKVVLLGTERLRVLHSRKEQTRDWACVFTFREDMITELLVLEDLSILVDTRATP